jgi:phosphoribosylformimino-5-aminoimidazole carboxamide ribotide isomerase
MLIPAIDLMGGRIVQLQQGERLAIETDDVDGWIARFQSFPLIQLVDLDAARNQGENDALVRRICRALPCQVGGGVRTVDRAAELIAAGAKRVVVGSALFDERGVDAPTASKFADTVGAARFVAAVDSRAGRVVTHGWSRSIALSPVDAVRSLSPFAGAFLATLVDGEGLMEGLDFEAAAAIRAATRRQVIVAGGIRDMADVDRLAGQGIDAVVGMAIYSGRMILPSSPEG